MTLTLKEAFDLYENGKHRRYSLLFAVNGGAFAVANLFTREPGKPPAALGNLTLFELSIGMALFTLVMVYDIWTFGEKMRKAHLPDSFGPEGKRVLLLLGALLCIGWLLAGWR